MTRKALLKATAEALRQANRCSRTKALREAHKLVNAEQDGGR
jgi:hypothetical protein